MFNSKKQVPVQKQDLNSEDLSKKTATALDVFISTINQLKAISLRASELLDSNQEKINALEEENRKLANLANSNTDLAESIDHLIHPNG